MSPDRVKTIVEFITKLSDVATMPVEWDGLGTVPLTDEALRAAILAVYYVTPDQGSPTPQVVPTRIGGVQVEWHVFNNDLEAVVAPDGSINILGVADDGKVEIDAEITPFRTLQNIRALGHVQQFLLRMGAFLQEARQSVVLREK